MGFFNSLPVPKLPNVIPAHPCGQPDCKISVFFKPRLLLGKGKNDYFPHFFLGFSKFLVRHLVVTLWHTLRQLGIINAKLNDWKILSNEISLRCSFSFDFCVGLMDFGIIASCGYLLDIVKKHVDATRPVIRKYLLLLWDPVLVSSGAPAGPQYVAHITTGLSASNLSVATWVRDGSIAS